MDTWGTKLNQNADTLDQFVSMATPIGVILDFAGSQAPAGWLIADGRLVSRATYAKLFAVIGVAWGAGDGSTNFALPNANGRAAVGPGLVTDTHGTTLTLTFSQTFGNIANPILQANLPNYAMTSSTIGNHNHAGYTTPAGSHAHTTDAQGIHAHTYNTGSTQPGVNDPQHYHGYADLWVTGTGYVAGLGRRPAMAWQTYSGPPPTPPPASQLPRIPTASSPMATTRTTSTQWATTCTASTPTAATRTPWRSVAAVRGSTCSSR